jgi:hypothetical protein
MSWQGHYCKVCGEYKANEKFSGKGHAAHICKKCASLPAEQKAEMETITRLNNLPLHLSEAQWKWLRSRAKDHRFAVKELAQAEIECRCCQ